MRQPDRGTYLTASSTHSSICGLPLPGTNRPIKSLSRCFQPTLVAQLEICIYLTGGRINSICWRTDHKRVVPTSSLMASSLVVTASSTPGPRPPPLKPPGLALAFPYHSSIRNPSHNRIVRHVAVSLLSLVVKFPRRSHPSPHN